MFDTSDMDSDEAELLEDAYKELSKRYTTSIENDFDIQFESFELFKVYFKFAYDQAALIHENYAKGYIVPIQITDAYNSKWIEYQLWGVVKLPRSFGRVFIKRESFKDRLLELFQPLEMNFPDDTEFCKRFYILVKDANKGSSLFNTQFRQALMNLYSKEIQLELLDQILIVGNGKSLGKEGFIEIAEFVKEVCNIRY
jgi:hypothetical protein